MKSFPFLLISKKVLQEKYHIHTRSGVQKTCIIVCKIHGYDKILLPLLKPEKAAKILAKLPGSTPMNQPQLVKRIPIRRGLGRTGLRRKVTGLNLLVKPSVFFQSLQIQKPTLPSQKPKISNVQRMIHPTSGQRNK